MYFRVQPVPRCLLQIDTGPRLTPGMPNMSHAQWTGTTILAARIRPRFDPGSFFQRVNIASDLRK